MLIRHHPARPRRWLMMLALLAALPLPSAAAARPSRQFSGCRSVQGDAWFVDELSFAPFTIAPGALVEPFGEGVRLSNSTATPLYLIEALQDAAFYAPAAPISLTAPLAVRQRTLAGRVARWYSLDGSSPPQWNMVGGFDSVKHDGSLSLLVRPNVTRVLRYGDGRPANAALPPAATYTLSVIYGAQLFAIPVTQTYRLNPHYDPNQERNERERCSRAGTGLVVVFGVASAVVAVLPVCMAVIIFFGLYGLVRMIRRDH